MNINFILNHHIFQSIYEYDNLSGYEMFKNEKTEKSKRINICIKSNIKKPEQLTLKDYDLNQFEQIKLDYPENTNFGKFIKKNEFLIKSELLLNLLYKEKIIISNNQAECNIFNKISNFIETGILI